MTIEVDLLPTNEDSIESVVESIASRRVSAFNQPVPKRQSEIPKKINEIFGTNDTHNTEEVTEDDKA